MAQRLNAQWRSCARDHVFALGVHEVFAVKDVFASGGISAKTYARPRCLSLVAKDHGLHRRGCA